MFLFEDFSLIKKCYCMKEANRNRIGGRSVRIFRITIIFENKAHENTSNAYFIK